MSLIKKIEEKYKDAIRSKNLDETNTLRLIKSAIKDKEIENRTNDSSNEIDDQQVLSLLQNLIKQRKDSIESFKSANRNDLIEKEQSEINLINQFLPEQLNEEDIKNIIKKIINEKKFTSIKDMGALMKDLKNQHAGSLDMAIAGKIAKSLLAD